MNKNLLPLTELVYQNSPPIDTLATLDAIKLIIDEQKNAVLCVQDAIDEIVMASSEIYKHLSRSKRGRIIYCGAGTSGRIGVQDGAELYPTFGWPVNRVSFLIAGGKEALVKSVENAEDDAIIAKKEIVNLSLNKDDVFIAIAASGSTPYTLEALKEAGKNKCLTLSITNNKKNIMSQHSKLKIILNTAQEVIAGSTRLKAGTAQKICLNIISTIVMTKMGNVKNGLMNNMVANNIKLKNRKKIITETLRKFY